MPARTQRTIMKHGSSGVIALPPDWRRFHNLRPGSRVTVIYDGILLIFPALDKHALANAQALLDALLADPIP